MIETETGDEGHRKRDTSEVDKSVARAGLCKDTPRRVEHITRVVFDVGDADDHRSWLGGGGLGEGGISDTG